MAEMDGSFGQSVRGKAGWVSGQARLAPSRMLFGNESGVRTNFAARRARSARSRVGIAQQLPEPDLLAPLRTNGFGIEPHAVRSSAIQSVQDSMWMCEDPDNSVPLGARIADSVRYVTEPVAKVPALREFVNPFVADVVRAWFNSEFRIKSVRFWRIASLPESENSENHYGNLWHVDRHHGQVLKMFVQVSDVSEDGAALRLISSAATRRAMRLGYFDGNKCLPRTRRLINERAVCFDAPPGAAIFFDPDTCLHRAGIPPAGTVRGMVQFWFEPADSAPPGEDYFDSIPPDSNVLGANIDEQLHRQTRSLRPLRSA